MFTTRKWWLLLVAALLPLSAHATAVTGTVTDTGSQTWNNGTWAVQVVPPAGALPEPSFNQSGFINSSGVFTVTLTPTASLAPAGSKWQLQVCPEATADCYVSFPIIVGASQSLTVTPPAILVHVQPGPVLLYQDNEFASPTVGQFYYNLTLFVYRSWNGTIWQSITPGGGGGGITSITATGPIVVTPSPITATGVISCPTCGVSSGSAVAGDTTFFSAPTTISGGTVILDMAGIAGADLGAKMNACDAQLPAVGGTCMGDNLAGPQTLSTAVTTTKATVFTFCGQAISETANINLNNSSASLVGCPGRITTITKGANIDQVQTNGANNVVKWIAFDGNKAGGFTGSGVVINPSNDLVFNNNTVVENNSFFNESNDAIKNNGGLWVYIRQNDIENWGTHALEMLAGLAFITENHIAGDGTGTGTSIVTTSEDTYTNNYVSDSSTHTMLDGSTLGGVPLVLIGNSLQHFGGGTVLSTSSGATVDSNFLVGGGANGPGVIGEGSYVNNVMIFGNNDGMQMSGPANQTIVGNDITLAVAASTGFCAVNIKGESIGAKISNNTINLGGTETGATYGVCLTTVAAQHTMDHMVTSNFVKDGITSAVDAAYFFNNTAGITTNGSDNRFVNNTCLHIHFCISRVDTHTLINYYENNQGDPVATFDAGGSTNDVIVQQTDSVGFTFATLPIAGQGSLLFCNDCTVGVPAAGGAGAQLTRIDSVWQGNLPVAVPTVSSGFGTGAAIAANPNFTTAFRLSVGTSNTGTGIIGLPVAKTGWNCTATDITTTSTTVSQTKQKATGSDSSHAALQNYTDISGTGAWTDNDVLAVSCFPF